MFTLTWYPNIGPAFHPGILVTADQDIVVQCINTEPYSSGAFRVPPVSQLGYVHVALMYKYTVTSTYQGPYQIAVVATGATTTSVEIQVHGPETVTLTFKGMSYTNDNVIAFTLQKYQTAQVGYNGEQHTVQQC